MIEKREFISYYNHSFNTTIFTYLKNDFRIKKSIQGGTFMRRLFRRKPFYSDTLKQSVQSLVIESTPIRQFISK